MSSDSQRPPASGSFPMNKRVIRAWALYDFANSVYPAVVTTAVFSVYYAGTIVGGEGGAGELWWGWAVATSALIVAFSSPVLGAVADRAGVRKSFFLFYVIVCIAGVALMTTLESGMVVAGFLMFVVANVGFESANVFYNSYLPDIAPVEQQGRVSGLGFGMGYLGSALGLILALLTLQVDFASLDGALSWVPALLDAFPFQLERIQVVWLEGGGFFLGVFHSGFSALARRQARCRQRQTICARGTGEHEEDHPRSLAERRAAEPAQLPLRFLLFH